MNYTIYFSYRVRKNVVFAQKIYNHLSKIFGENALKIPSFQAGIPKNIDVDYSITRSDCFLVILEEDWNKEDGENYERQLIDLFVTQIWLAIRKEMYILPILANKTKMSSSFMLPQKISALRLRNGLMVRDDGNFEEDMSIVVQTLCQFFEIPDRSNSPELYEGKNITRASLTPITWEVFEPVSPSIGDIFSGNVIFQPNILNNIDISDCTTRIENFFEVRSIRFFEDGEKASPADQRQYRKEFEQHLARYVYCELKVSNLLHQKKLHTHYLVWRYTHSNGQLLGEISADFPILPEWYSAWHQHGFGWRQPGNWLLGEYSVAVYSDNILLGVENFSIIENLSNPSQQYENKFFKLISIRFFESGDNVANLENRRYHNQFAQENARYIYCEVRILNHFYQHENHIHRIVWKYYKPDGSLLGTISAEFNVLATWYTAWHQRGCGWGIAGNWQKGSYFVKIFMDDDFVGEDTFTIV